ncbi:hypothetical protein Rhe02_33980 [Rhizocola hellebori]|uniref:Uncharacterized protein n=1 Tax=Rhizocola hellebori TaxID=1392758 RepID=A0A8J3Q8W9_9ACTN|nr:hypothetical protein Rhe02_33980 [Rhizocola hellebori]
MPVRTIDRQSVRSWRPRSGGRLVAPDGSTLSLKHDTSPLDEPWFTECRIRYSATPQAGEFGGRAFETGPVGTVDGHVAVLLEGSYIAEYEAQGGTFLLAATADRATGLVAWQGRWHEAYCWVNEPGATHVQMLSKFDRLTFVDTPAGLRVELPSGETYQRITANKHVPDIGFLQIVQAATAAAALPAWSGHRVRVGEVWRQLSDAKDASPTTVLVCASPTAVVSLQPRGGTEDAGLGFLTGLSTVSWT